MERFDLMIDFDDYDACNIMEEIVKRLPKSNFVGALPVSEQYEKISGELRGFLDGVAYFIGRDAVVEIMEEATRIDDDSEPEDDDDYMEDDEDEFEDYIDDDGEFDLAAYVHDQDSDHPMCGW